MLGLLTRSYADGFIVISTPTHVPSGHYAFAPLEVVRHDVVVKTDGHVATTTVDQEFYNPNDERLEGTYMFPVPKDAHIDKFSMEIGGKMIEAELLPADKARKTYEEIVRKMRDPALLEYAGRDLFKVRIYPIEPHSRKQVKLSYTELLHSDAGMTTYLYPLSTEKFSSQPVKNLSIKMEVESKAPLASIYSPSHAVDIKRDGPNRARIAYEASNTKPDTDFQLVFAQDSHDVGVNLMSYKTEGEDGYFMLLATPAVDTKNAERSAKDVVFVVDSSGSMSGAKLEQAKKALLFCIENLNAEDRFEIVRFSTETEEFFGKLAEATVENRKRAAGFIHDVKPTGGTAIAQALQTALKARPEKGDRPFVVIFLTDGLPTVGTQNPEEIVAGVRKAGGNVRIFSFGIGSDVNTQLLDQIAETTRAFSQYVLPEEDLEVKLSSFFSKIKEPALTSLRVEFKGDVRVNRLYPGELPDLFKGDQLVLTGRYTGSGEVEAHLTGMAAGHEQTFTYKLRFDAQNTTNDFVPRLWATRRVGFLLDEIRLHSETAELRDEATELARKFGIVTPYTAYLIVEDEARRNVPTTMRSMQRMEGDRVSMDRAKDAWAEFKGVKQGAGGIANAQSQNLFKYADQVGTTLVAGNDKSLAAMTLAAPVALPATSRNRAPAAPVAAEQARTRIAQYTRQSKFVNGRTFFQNGNQWVDTNAQKLTKRQQVQFNSEAYFALLAKHPEAAPWFALGQNVLIALDDTVYEVTE